MESAGTKEEPQGQTTVPEWSEMALPGFRFHPTEEELVGYYLRRMVQGKRNSVELIASLDLYQYDPWELPAMAFMGEKEWFFFCPRDKKYPNGARPNRVTASGYWKATGTDRPVRCTGDSRCIGLKKTLVFYTGRAPRGNKTEWIMNEYRMPKPAEQSISVLTSGVNSINYYSATCDNLVVKNDVALCRIYRKSSSALNSLSFISAIAARDLEQRTLSSRMMSRFEDNHPAPAYEQQQQQLQQQHHHHHLERLQLQEPPPNTASVRGSVSEMPDMTYLSAASPLDHDTAQQATRKTTASLVTQSHAQLVETETQRQQQLLLDGGGAVAAVRGTYNHSRVVPSIIECTTTSEEASKKLQIALRTAMAKLDGRGSSTTINFNDGESIETNGTGILGCFRSRMVEDNAGGAAASPSRSAMRSPSPEEVAAATATTHHKHFGHPPNSCSRDISVGTPLLRCSSSSDNMAASAFTPMTNDRSCCSSPRILIPPSISHHHHVNSSPSTIATTATTTRCIEGVRAAPNATALGLHTINDNSSSHISASANPQFEDEVQTRVNACSIPSLTNTYSLKRSRFTRVQLVGENFPLAKMPSVAQYWRQPSAASDSGAAAAAQLSTFDALSGLAFQY